MRRRLSQPGCWIEADRAATFSAHTLMRIDALALWQQSAFFIMIIYNFAQSLVGEWALFACLRRAEEGESEHVPNGGETLVSSPFQLFNG
jgi:hypothetical protein